MDALLANGVATFNKADFPDYCIANANEYIPGHSKTTLKNFFRVLGVNSREIILNKTVVRSLKIFFLVWSFARLGSTMLRRIVVAGVVK
jgi:hypothetical protein